MLLVIGTSEPEVEVAVGELAAWLISVARLFCQTYWNSWEIMLQMYRTFIYSCMFDLIVSLSATLNCRHCFAVVELILVRFLSGGFEACTQRLRRCANVILCKSFSSPQWKFILTHQTHDLCNQRMSWLVLRSLREKTCSNTSIYYN